MTFLTSSLNLLKINQSKDHQMVVFFHFIAFASENLSFQINHTNQNLTL